MHGQIVFGKRDNVATIFQKVLKLKIKMAVPDDAVEDSLLGHDVALVLHHKGPGFSQFYGVITSYER